MPPRLQTAKWVDVVFGEATNVTRDGFEAALDELPAEEIDVAWRTLTSAPKLLRKNEVQSKLRAIAPNGAVDEATWAAAAAETRAAPVVDVVDYESMETADLKALCKDRGIRPLPVRRLVIEDLRFYDAHGVAGVRHPATEPQLGLPQESEAALTGPRRSLEDHPRPRPPSFMVFDVAVRPRDLAAPVLLDAFDDAVEPARARESLADLRGRPLRARPSSP